MKLSIEDSAITRMLKALYRDRGVGYKEKKGEDLHFTPEEMLTMAKSKGRSSCDYWSYRMDLRGDDILKLDGATIYFVNNEIYSDYSEHSIELSCVKNGEDDYTISWDKINPGTWEEQDPLYSIQPTWNKDGVEVYGHIFAPGLYIDCYYNNDYYPQEKYYATHIVLNDGTDYVISEHIEERLNRNNYGYIKVSDITDKDYWTGSKIHLAHYNYVTETWDYDRYVFEVTNWDKGMDYTTEEEEEIEGLWISNDYQVVIAERDNLKFDGSVELKEKGVYVQYNTSDITEKIVTWIEFPEIIHKIDPDMVETRE